ncbi:uncharacterized protein AMSG_08099 [Thecamonas trahens ATCC 50062]|uniref:PPM-type phosphatase domain-containing protein n=1 Tax=Thecamonas trahens ATCC 50062 TaxID=461836 RepID=A0A0L0DMB2_THETB|nr:hypothetical protein AMSG_08099 [Thecamonas trahens ATCC 50062]KNC52533.1 hypothetical protein AMSG_08099 [Thecamonas trahens ATCC 50062]|eukprot:XP_013755325.1 hypothetical protein AMSG_08099 [Thecamonas trahens ATCC 50062]
MADVTDKPVAVADKAAGAEVEAGAEVAVDEDGSVGAMWNGCVVMGDGVAEDKNRKYRRTMEDKHIMIKALETGAGELVEVDGVQPALYAVFDGHGGRKASALMEKQFPTILATSLEAVAGRTAGGRHVGVALADALAHADHALLEDGIVYSGATVAVALVVPDSTGRGTWIHSANAGDTRTVLVVKSDAGDATAIRLSRDHKADDADEVERIEAAGGFVSGGRVVSVLAVARALGDGSMKDFVPSEPYLSDTLVTAAQLAAGAFFIMACDGVWDVIPDDDAAAIVAQELVTDTGTEASAAKALVRAAIDVGSTDNVTVIVVRLAATGRA